MAKGEYLRDPLGGGGQINHMPSGLIHLSDSQAGGIKGEVKIIFGAPGSPMQKSNGVESNLYGKAPASLFKKFQKREQR